MKQIGSRLFSFLFVTLYLTVALATPRPLNFEHKFNLSQFSGNTFLYAMTNRNGIKAAIDKDYESTYQVADWKTVQFALNNFDRKIVMRVLGAFKNSRAELQEFVESIEGQNFRPSNIVGLIQKNYRGPGNIYVLAHFIGMASGAGTLVTIDSDSYYYNFGYKPGENPDDVKSGRSYGAGPLHNANDASDVMYLDELEQYMKSTKNPSKFYEVFMRILTQSNTMGFSTLSPLGQTAMTDLVAIYTAELNRHIMVDLHPSKHPWENDLAEATFLASYTSVENKIMKNGKLVNGRMRNYWAMSEVSNRSGIGIGRTDRRKLQRLISRYIRTNHNEASDPIDRIIGKRADGDLFRGVMEYLNDYDNQTKVRANGRALGTALVNLLIVVQNEATEITEAVEKWQ